MEYNPVVYTLPKPKDDIFGSKDNFQVSNVIEYPKFSLGFQHFLHQSKDKMKIIDQFKDKKKVYLVMNDYETNVDEYKDDISNVSGKYFGLDKIPEIQSREFYKLWEILLVFNLIPADGSKFKSVHLCEGSGSFLQAVMLFRDILCKKGASKNDQYHILPINCEYGEDDINKPSDNFINYYKKEKPERVQIHKPSKGFNVDDVIKQFKKDGTDFITANSGFITEFEITQEHESLRLILGQICAAIQIQNKGGHFVCKFYETFTNVSCKIICMLNSLYGEVHIIKPVMSRGYTSERYVVCMNFLDNKNVSKCTGFINKLLGTNGNITNIFMDYMIPRTIQMTITEMNIEIANRQFIAMNEVVSFIEAQNYRGELYHQRRNRQIEANKLFIQLFLTSGKKADIGKIVDNIIKRNNKNIGELDKMIE